MTSDKQSNDYKKVAIVGKRNINSKIKLHIWELAGALQPKHLVTGDAEGVDKEVREIAETRNISITICYADWKLYGKAAGPIRNALIVAEADRMIAFWDGKSKGTKNAIEQMTKANKPVEVILI